jgi:hypothetical protein
MSKERRQFERYAFRSVIQIEVRGEAAFPSQAVNLSVGGLCFVSPLGLTTGDAIKIRFQLGEQRIVAEAQVRHATRVTTEIAGVDSGEQFIVGVQFINQSPEQRQWLASGLRHLPED